MNRGPQPVQVVNGYPVLLPERMSARHSGQTAVSAGMGAPRLASSSDSVMEKPSAEGSRSRSLLSMLSILASGGRLRSSSARSSSPLSASIVTQEPSLRTVPRAPTASAAR